MFSTASETRTVVWKTISSAPHETEVLLGYWKHWPKPKWIVEVGYASQGQRYSNGYSNYHRHGYATHWMELPGSPEEIGFVDVTSS